MKIMKKKLRLLARVMVVIMIIGLTYTGNFNNNIVLADTTDQNSNTKDTNNKGNKPPETDKSGQPVKANDQTSQVKDKNTKSNSNEIDEKIYGLSYDPKKILTLNGEKIENFVPAEGYEDSDKYVVIKREKKSISDSTADISIIDSINDRTYPGAIQLANRNLIENKPDLVSCERKPITISVDLPGMTSDGKKVVKSPTYSSVNSAINSILDTWNTKYSQKYTIPTRVSYSDTMVYSKSQLSTMLGCNFKSIDKSLNIDFNSIFKGEKKVMVVAYKQIFYTVSVDAPNRPSDVFGDNVTFNELALKGLNNNNPPAYVSNVAYGRTIYVKLETTSKSGNVKAAFKALIDNQDISSNAEYKDILNQSSFTATVLGGGAQEHNKIVTKDFDEIRNVIKNNSVYSPQNPGYPISYTTTFLKDNHIASINNKTEYVETTATEYNNGKIVLDHSGAYVAQFQVTWDEVSYDKQGNEIVEHKGWSGNNTDKTAHFNTEIYLKGNARNISVQIKECTGLAWEWWRTIVDVKNIPLVKERTFYIWGTTLYPKHSIEEK
ncbi:thiol-activated cytolysin family protein [Clostridium botulinum]|uniref:thiol-activated cytolysin family protein n=1 Tax=Clostridium botulinum TaxID=1491 RepID=UPI0004DB0B6E|nr:thiol-activated cytolysin family protein [Clostridium botulinum]KEI07058.1 alveolysin [Clostridium botulinum C/D str. BKT75002]KEI12135.1 alveolysin [Clostridium botulinum C/D str. BKT2873]MCD3351861.1 alveolysin [Clostridium botulinum D/C]MCD3359076.1 alveolysin [Clostridium botulinum D/C]MCD3363874.1 alveolysin [Clostridium botulinum D/C]